MPKVSLKNCLAMLVSDTSSLVTGNVMSRSAPSSVAFSVYAVIACSMSAPVTSCRNKISEHSPCSSTSTSSAVLVRNAGLASALASRNLTNLSAHV